MKNGPYILVKAPESYPGKKYRNKYVYEHHLVWWLKTGQLLRPDQVIHHLDGDKHNNDYANLALITKKEHLNEHRKDFKFKYSTERVELKCSWCNQLFQMLKSSYVYKLKQEQNKFYCCRSHQVRAQQKVRVQQSPRISKTCEVCAKEFKAILERARFCSKKCTSVSNRPGRRAYKERKRLEKKIDK